MEAFGIDPIKIVIYIVLIVILYLILDKFILSKLTNNLDKRKDQIDKNIKLTNELEERMNKLQLEVESKLKETKNETDKIIDSSKKDGLKEREVILVKANNEAKQIIESAMNKLEQEKSEMKNEMKKEVEKAVKKAVEDLWQERVEKVDSSLIDKAIKQIKDN